MNNEPMFFEQQATVCRVLHEDWEWQVQFQGSYWTARSVDTSITFRPNDRVDVVGRKNLLLLIQPTTL